MRVCPCGLETEVVDGDILISKFKLPTCYYIHFQMTTFEKVSYIYIYIYMYISEIIVIESDPKVPFSIASTPRCRGCRYSFPWIAPLYP